MFIKNYTLECLVEEVLRSEGISNADIITEKIMSKLTQYHRDASKKGGRPQKKINFDIVDRQIQAKVPFNAIAASQKVSEDTLRKRIREKKGLP